MTDDLDTGSSPEPVEQSTDNVTTDEKPAESSTAPAESTEGQERDKRNKISERIGKLTRERYEAINKAKELEEKFKALEDKYKSLDTGPKEPSFDDYGYDKVDEYKSAYRDYVIETQKRETQAQKESASGEDVRRQSEREQMERANKFAQKAQAEADRYKGYWDAMKDEGFQVIINSMNPDIISQIQDSEKSTALSYHLATNLDVADNIARLSPVQAARELMKIEMDLDTPSPKKVSNAPDPIDPIGSSGQGDLPLNKINDIDDWMAKRNAQVLNRR